MVTPVYRQLLAQNSSEPSPYWARLWPSAIALATFIQHHPQWVAGKWLAELGAGIGLPSLAAAAFAKQVWCSDLVPEAAGVVAKSALLHGFTNLEAAACHWEDIPDTIQPDILLLSDVNYEPGIFAALLQVIKGFLERGTTVLLATPQRLMAGPFILQLLDFVTEQTTEEVSLHDQVVSISIFVLRKTEKSMPAKDFS